MESKRLQWKIKAVDRTNWQPRSCMMTCWTHATQSFPSSLSLPVVSRTRASWREEAVYRARPDTEVSNRPRKRKPIVARPKRARSWWARTTTETWSVSQLWRSMIRSSQLTSRWACKRAERATWPGLRSLWLLKSLYLPVSRRKKTLRSSYAFWQMHL